MDVLVDRAFVGDWQAGIECPLTLSSDITANPRGPEHGEAGAA